MRLAIDVTGGPGLWRDVGAGSSPGGRDRGGCGTAPVTGLAVKLAIGATGAPSRRGADGSSEKDQPLSLVMPALSLRRVQHREATRVPF